MEDAGFGGTGDDTKVGGGADVVAGCAEVRLVQRVEKLAPKVELDAFANGEGLLDGEVEVDGTGGAEEVTGGVPVSADSVEGDLVAVEVGAQVVVAGPVRRQGGVAAEVGAVEADAGEGVVASGVEAEGQAGADVEKVEQISAAEAWRTN